MDALGDLLPARYLLAGVETGCTGIADALLRNLSSFGDDKTCSCALGIIRRAHVAGHLTRLGPTARHRSHDNPIWELDGPQYQRREKVNSIVVHGTPLRSSWKSIGTGNDCS